MAIIIIIIIIVFTLLFCFVSSVVLFRSQRHPSEACCSAGFFCVCRPATDYRIIRTTICASYLVSVRGQMVKTDATVRFFAGTVLAAVKGLFFVLGEDGKIQRCGAVKSEKKEQIYPLLSR